MCLYYTLYILIEHLTLWSFKQGSNVGVGGGRRRRHTVMTSGVGWSRQVCLPVMQTREVAWRLWLARAHRCGWGVGEALIATAGIRLRQYFPTVGLIAADANGYCSRCSQESIVACDILHCSHRCVTAPVDVAAVGDNGSGGGRCSTCWHGCSDSFMSGMQAIWRPICQ